MSAWTSAQSQINIEALIWELERRSRALVKRRSSARDERSRALVSKTVLVTSGHYLLFFYRRFDDVRSWRALISGLRSRALVDRYFRSRAIMIWALVARECSSAHFFLQICDLMISLLRRAYPCSRRAVSSLRGRSRGMPGVVTVYRGVMCGQFI